MSVEAIAWAFKVGGLTAAQKFTLVAIADNANDDGCAFPSIPTIAKKTSQSVSTIKRHIKALERVGAIEKLSRYRDNGGKSANEYRLSFAPTGQNDPYPPTGQIMTRGHRSDNDPSHRSDNDPSHRSLVNRVSEPSSNHQSNRQNEPVNDTAPDAVDLAVEAWNDLADECKLPRCQKITKARRSAIGARLKDAGGLDGWIAALGIVRGNAWMHGDNATGWRVNIDFMARESSFTKLMEGAYTDSSGSRKSDMQKIVERHIARCESGEYVPASQSDELPF